MLLSFLIPVAPGRTTTNKKLLVTRLFLLGGPDNPFLWPMGEALTLHASGRPDLQGLGRRDAHTGDLRDGADWSGAGASSGDFGVGSAPRSGQICEHVDSWKNGELSAYSKGPKNASETNVVARLMTLTTKTLYVFFALVSDVFISRIAKKSYCPVCTSSVDVYLFSSHKDNQEKESALSSNCFEDLDKSSISILKDIPLWLDSG